MIDVSGNLWTYEADVHAITTNGFVKSNGACVMGRGCAKEARDRYPGLDVRLGKLIRENGNRCFRIPVFTDEGPYYTPDGPMPERTLLTFPVKHHWNEQADLDLIAKSCEQATEMATKFNWQSVVLPRPGSGNGRLDYLKDVRPVIAPLLDDRFKIITFA